MPLLADRVLETTTTTGTGSFSLAGALTGYRTFNSVFTNGDVVYYTADNGQGEWEVGYGTVGTGTLSRNVIESSNANALVDFSAGTKRLFCTAPAQQLPPNQTGNSGKVLSTDGSNLSWTTPAAGTVTAVSVSTANGLAGSSSGGATPALTLSTTVTGLLKGDGTAISAASAGTDYAPATSGTSLLYGNGSGGFSNATVGTGLSFAGGTLSASSEGQSIQAIASGTLSDGTKVIVNSDGTVSAITATASTPTIAGSATAFNSVVSYYMSAVYDSANSKVVLVYQNNSTTYGTAIVGTVSGTSISFGTAVVFSSANTTWISAVYDSANSKVVIAYNSTSGYGYAIVGTVSGTSISFGSQASLNFGYSTAYISATYDSANSKVIVAYYGSSEYGYAKVGTVSGTDISFGPATTFNSAATTYTAATYDSANSKVVIAYNSGASAYAYAIVGTVSGTSISFGTAVVFNSAYTYKKSIAYSPIAGKVVVAYFTNTDGKAIVGTVSGTSISFGSPSTYVASYSSGLPSVTYDPFSQRIMLAYPTNFNTGYVVAATISGTSISFGTAVTFVSSAECYYISATYDSTNLKMVIAYDGPSRYGYTTIVSTFSSNLTATNFIGISNGAYTNGQTATVQIIGAVDDAQSGLTAGQAYYVQPTGNLSSTAATPSVFAGTAISSTKLIVKG